jgi:hypothetical protein
MLAPMTASIKSFTTRVLDFAGRRCIGTPAELGLPDALSHLYFTPADRALADLPNLKPADLEYQRGAIATNSLIRQMNRGVGKWTSVWTVLATLALLVVFALANFLKVHA